ncbi:DUF2339 domain-containing protein [Mycolicibacterium fluoranthenivorans]|uniref:Putative membrane protein n=1 Tax=Mycolicibacterium fluoranthenivorans TaxID=258505 RepID=A0A7X5U3B5_9MYCO|nr:DUF2339 domain-containing protein [Mycolicibacterium fluoranthenivorans]MCV7358621.1 DUF2339 domain-containing protein [Mycolicibacterium fluoranthenivorans]NIH97547.1 putative membrane protein [Mycolicibacterium fluoranthenivorans]
MTEPQQALVRLSAEFAAIAGQLTRASAELYDLGVRLNGQPAVPAPVYWPYPQQPQPQPQPQPLPLPLPQPAPVPREPTNWIGKALAAAGVAVTLIGVVLLVVLAAQAGLLAPPVRVAGGVVLAAALVSCGLWQRSRPGGAVGAIALAATGIAAAYIDVLAVTTMYDWLPAPAGLAVSATVGGGGLLLARRWETEQLALLVLVPLIVLAPIVAGGITLLLVGFMLALSAATLPVQIGRDWLWMFAARTAAGSAPVMLALVGVAFGSGHDAWLAGACALAAILALGSALVVLPHSTHRGAVALLAAAGALPVLAVGAAVHEVVAALMAAALSAAVLALVLSGHRIPGVTTPVRQVWTALSAICALVAVGVGFAAPVAGPVLLAMAILAVVAGRHSVAAQWSAALFGGFGGLYLLSMAGPATLTSATVLTAPDAVSVLISSVLLGGYAGAQCWAARSRLDGDRGRLLLAGAAAVLVYAVTVFTVTAGVLIAGPGGGFLAGQMAATICWIALAAALFGYAARRAREDRSLPIGAGMALVAAAVAKLFVFDLGTLDGMFRVAVFIVVGLVLLGMGAGYARLLSQQHRN